MSPLYIYIYIYQEHFDFTCACSAKAIFEERLRPQGAAAEDPLAQFITAAGRVPADTPMSFVELLGKCCKLKCIEGGQKIGFG